VVTKTPRAICREIRELSLIHKYFSLRLLKLQVAFIRIKTDEFGGEKSIE
jgi:hypothetical protein